MIRKKATHCDNYHTVLTWPQSPKYADVRSFVVAIATVQYDKGENVVPYLTQLDEVDLHHINILVVYQ